MYQLEVPASKSTTNDEDPDTFNACTLFMQMEELYDKLKLLNHETEFIKHFKIVPINRHYFVLQTNPGEQFYVFSLLSVWLIQKCGLFVEPPQEYDDPNSTIASILNAARQLDITVDFPPNKLKQGWGRFVVLLLNNFCDKCIQNSEFSYSKPILPVEINDEEVVGEDNSELLLERIEEEMAAEDFDSDDDEDDTFLHVDDLNKLNFHSQKVDDTLHTNITYEEWQLETEKVLPSLRLTIKSDNKDWRGHIELIKQYKSAIDDSMRSVESHLGNLTADITETMDKIVSREKFLNANLDSLLTEYRTAQELLWKTNNRFRELNGGVIEKQRNLGRISEELDSLKQEIEERGTIMTDGTPLVNIKKAVVTLKEDTANMNVLIGILQHDIFHSKLREKLLLQQKFNSPIYA